MKQIFIINGPPRSGKDTFVDMCRSISDETNGPVFHNISSVDKVKQAAEILGWDGLKDEKGRKFLSDLKDLSTELYDGPLNYMKSKIEKYPFDIGFFHVREPSEIHKIVKLFPSAKTIFIQRETQNFNNHADKNVEMYDYDFYIDNTSSLALSPVINLTPDLVFGSN